MHRKVNVGQRIKEYRQRYNLTLKEIESRVAVSATHVSEIERGKTSPTVGALSKIADALEVDAALFLTDDNLPQVMVNRAENRGTIHVEADGYRIEPVSCSVPGQDLSVALVTWEPGAVSAKTHQHPGEEFGLVLAGALEITVGEQTFEVEAGDTIHFRAELPHVIRNRRDEPCRGLWAATPVYGV